MKEKKYIIILKIKSGSNENKIFLPFDSHSINKMKNKIIIKYNNNNNKSNIKYKIKSNTKRIPLKQTNKQTNCKKK